MDRPEILMACPMLPVVTDGLAEVFSVHKLWENEDQDTFLRDHGGQIRGIATSPVYNRIETSLLERLPNLEIISTFGVGYDNVDIAAAEARGITVTNTPGVLDDEVADLTIGLTLSTLRQIPQADRFLREGRWLDSSFPLTCSMRDRAVGIAGLGRIGRAIARRFEGFGVPISYYGRTRQENAPYTYFPTILELASACNLLIVSTPGGPETENLIDIGVLQALGPHGLLINVSRGSVVDERALIRALQDKIILGAGLDVYQDEPNVPPELIDMDNVVLLPHVASGSVQTRNAMGDLVVRNLVSWFATGSPLNPVTKIAKY